MPVYWSMLLVTILFGGISYVLPRKIFIGQNGKEYKTKYIYAIITFLYIAFLCGMRDEVLDTATYISIFETMPDKLGEMVKFVIQMDSDTGFYLLSGLFKIFISDSHYAWLTCIAIVSCICLLKPLYKYSVDFPLTAYLFVASATFTWLINGIRQFLAVAILFAFSNWLIEGKKIRYMILIILTSTIHSSAIIFLPICFFVSCKKIFDKKMKIFLLITIIGTYYSDSIFVLFEDYSESLLNASGSSAIRLLIAAIPVLIVLLAKKYVIRYADKSIILAINMSIVGVCFYFAATFTSGILVGRLPIYFSVYNLYLLPWLIKKCFNKRSSQIMWLLCVGLYFLHFMYQMLVAWGGLPYVSDILGISY